MEAPPRRDFRPARRVDGPQSARPANRKRGRAAKGEAGAGKRSLTLKLDVAVVDRLKLLALQEHTTTSDLVAKLVEQHCRTYSVTKRWAVAKQKGEYE